MALTDRVMEHGRSLDGLAPSTYEATLAFNLGSGYPVGVLLPLGIARELVGQDVAWVIQPYMAFLAGLLAAGLWSAAGSLVRSPWLRALAAFLAAQSALLFGYYLWGGIKEVAAATLVVTVAGLAALVIRERLAWRTLAPLAVASAALIGILSGGGAVWLGPILLATLVAAWRMLGVGAALGRAAAFAAALAALSIPVIAPGGLLPPTSSPLTSETALGNLFRPLSALRLFGVWPSGDFRADPTDPATAHVLIAVVALAALVGIGLAVRARAWSLLLYVGAAVVAGLAIFVIGSPWAALYAEGRRVEGGILMAVLAAGILWSNALAYRDVNLAPRDQLAELQKIGELIAGQGPTLMTEYQPYGARHFLRNAAPEAASELRRRRVPLLSGRTLRKGAYADTDRFKLHGLEVYRTLVVRRSPAQSRPPLPYRLIWRGHYYEAWQRPAGSEGVVRDHLGLGNEVDPGGVPKCADVLHLADEAGPNGRLAAVGRAPVVIVSLKQTSHPRAWNSPDYASALLPTTPGAIKAQIRVSKPGGYEIWLGGSVRPQVDVAVDGRPVGSVREQLENSGQYVSMGTAPLDPGEHTVTIRFHGADLHPGSGGAPDPIGPLVLSQQDMADTRVVYFPPSEATRLCGKRWDWIEALG
ncbi:MAG: hypothetical protein E6G48_00745 [Actinobacteria bacterium]|nr:MAG: hypothetical protein E6G48_00745 [Actinomycetota bacterium]